MPKPRARRGRSEGSIYQRPDGLWVASLSLGVHGKKRIRRVAYGKTKGEAAAKLRELQTSIDAGRLPDAGSITVETWLTRWLVLIESTVEPNTLAPYRRHVHLHISPRIGSAKMQRFRPTDVEAFYAKMLKDGVSANYARKIGTTLSVALNHAVRSQLIPANPSSGVKKPKGTKPKIEILAESDAASLVVACEAERLGPLFVLILDSGVRPGEALALTWLDIDFTAGTISITKSLEEIAGKKRLKKPKTARGIRKIEITPTAITALNRHRQAMLREGRDVRKGVVFVNDRGKHLSISNLHRSVLTPILKRARLPAISVYALRHTCATLLLLGGVNPKIVSERLGHSSIAITLDTYSHVLPTMQRAAVDVLAKSLSGMKN